MYDVVSDYFLPGLIGVLLGAIVVRGLYMSMRQLAVALGMGALYGLLQMCLHVWTMEGLPLWVQQTFVYGGAALLLVLVIVLAARRNA